MDQINNDKNISRFADVVIFLFPIFTLSTSFGMALAQVVILITVLARRDTRRFYATHWRAMRLMAAGFVGYLVISLLRMLLTDPSWQPLDGPLRLLMSLTCIAFVGALRPSPRAFWSGLACGAIAAGIIALVQHLTLGGERVEGMTHHAITFGNLSLMTGLLACCGLPALRHSRLAWLPWLALLCGLLASLLSGSRGGWLALPFATLLLLHHGKKRYGYGKLLAWLALVVLLLLATAMLFRNSVAVHRMALIHTEVSQYYFQNNMNTSIGIRLELWKASWLMFIDHPLLGVGREGFDLALRVLVQQGRLEKSAALTFSTSHNDMLHMLASGGLLDFSLLMLMYFGPLVFFRQVMRRPDSAAHPAALGGILLVVCFMIFGLTDVMFWLMTPKSYYAMMVCVLAGFCLLPPPRQD